MTAGAPDLDTCVAVAQDAAEAAGVVLLEQLGRVPSESKEFRRELVTAADRAAERVVVQALLEAFPDHAVLAEEGELTPKGRPSSDSDWRWIVDPLDGTTNFVHQLPFFCVAVGLAHRGEPVAGVVHAPVLGSTWAARRGGGATRDGSAIAVSTTENVADALFCTGFSYSRNEPGEDDNVDRLRRVLHACRDLRRYGSAQLDLCLVADGRYDGYWELGLAPYDVAAGSIIVREAGGAVSDLVGGDGWLYGGNIVATNAALGVPLRGLLDDDGS